MTSRLIAMLMRQTRANGLRRPPEPDAALVARIANRRDDAAFTELVQRHGPMVWAVCRHAVPCEADAEDAFQATFLALTRSAGRLVRPEAVAAWLHGAAVRICLLERRATRRRATREAKVARTEAVCATASSWADDLSRAHEAIRRLPRREHEVFVLCALEGEPQSDVAKRLGVKLGSISGRLARARQRLQRQLSAPGVLALGALSVAVSCPAAIPSTLLVRTIQLATNPAEFSSPYILSLSSSLTEATMRKVFFVVAVTLAGFGGLTFGTFASSKAEAQQTTSNRQSSQLSLAAAEATQGQAGAQGKSGGEYVVGFEAVAPEQQGSWWSTTPPPPPEYKVLLRDSAAAAEASLNELAHAGWELSSASASDGKVLLVLKRPRPISKMTDKTRQAIENWTFQRGQINANRKFDNDTQGTWRFGVKGAELPSQSEPKVSDGEASGSQHTTYRLRRANASEVAELLKGLVPGCEVEADKKGNSVKLRGRAADVQKLRRILEKLEEHTPEGGR